MGEKRMEGTGKAEQDRNFIAKMKKKTGSKIELKTFC